MDDRSETTRPLNVNSPYNGGNPHTHCLRVVQYHFAEAVCFTDAEKSERKSGAAPTNKDGDIAADPEGDMPCA
jgi:hypothetical protein